MLLISLKLIGVIRFLCGKMALEYFSINFMESINFL